MDRPVALGYLDADCAPVLPVGHTLDNAPLRHQVTGTLGAHAGAARSLGRRSSDSGVVELDRLEVGQESPDAFGRAVRLHFVMDGRHGQIHKSMLVVYQTAA